VTTGIYCQPGCSARPNRENLTSYALAAAAEADGFRACYRCRPYRESVLAPWTAPELVCRAVRLILDGALDTDNEETLGSRLGVSGRHLRRLFQEHLGVTPDGLARSSRTHFARRLLDDTDLSVLEIAFAAGFGSVRQFNRSCRDVFRASPRELRARRRVTDRLVADGGLPLRLMYHGPLDWTALIEYLGARAIPGVEEVSDQTYRRTIVVDGDPGVIELRPGGHEEIVLVVHLPHWEELIHVVERARRICGLNLDIAEAERHLGRDDVIGPIVRAHSGVRVPGTWDPFETGVRAIVGQQISIAAANTISGRLISRLGTTVPGLSKLGLTHTFPSAEIVADADLGGLGLTPARAEAVRAFSRAVAEGDIRLVGSASLEELLASVTAVAGLGDWTANYIALRLGERDAFPANDLGLRRALAGYADSKPVELAERWRPWRALAATQLWSAAVAPAELARGAA